MANFTFLYDKTQYQLFALAAIEAEKVFATYIELNGYMDSVADLAKPPFDKPVSFMKLFDPGRKKKLIDAIEAVKKNAVEVTA